MAVVIGAMFFLLLDRILKSLALAGNFDTPKKILGDFFALYFTPNYYIAFSLPLKGLWLNILISSLVVLLLIYLFRLILKKKFNDGVFLPLTILLFGAISNLTDRWFLGYVVDYFDLKFFTIFNLADALIVSAAIYYIARELWPKKK